MAARLRRSHILISQALKAARLRRTCLPGAGR